MEKSATEARKEYMRKYRAEHREAINAKKREWVKRNPDRSKAYMQKYWAKKAQEGGINAESNTGN